MWKASASLLLNLLLYNAANSFNIYNESCTVTVTSYEVQDSCDIEQGFKCHPELHVCRCYNETSMQYDPQREKCIVQGYGSICVDETMQNEFACKDPLQCSQMVGYVFQSIPACYCEEPFYLPSEVNASSGNEPTCLPARRGLSCSNSFPCHESKGLICLEGKCRCPLPASQIFTNEGCVGIPEFPNGCNLEENREKHCFEGSSCGGDKTCHCNPGSTLEIGSYPRYCRLDHGQPCKGEEDCNTSRGLKCINGICSCERDSNIQYDAERRICTLSEGVPCDSKLIGSNLPCSAGLECRQTKNDPFLEKCVKVYDEGDALL